MSLAFRLLTVASLFGCLFVVIPTNGESPDAKSQTANSAKPAAGDTASKVASNSAKLTVAVLDFSANNPGQLPGTRQAAWRSDCRRSLRQAGHYARRSTIDAATNPRAIAESHGIGRFRSGSEGWKARRSAAPDHRRRILRFGKQLTITAKMIGTETSQVDSIAVKGGVADADLGDLATKTIRRSSSRGLAKSVPSWSPLRPTPIR